MSVGRDLVPQLCSRDLKRAGPEPTHSMAYCDLAFLPKTHLAAGARVRHGEFLLTRSRGAGREHKGEI